jgi:hypothetical protein
MLTPAYEKYLPNDAASVALKVKILRENYNQLEQQFMVNSGLPPEDARELQNSYASASTVQDLVRRAENAKSDLAKDNWHAEAAYSAAAAGDAEKALSIAEKILDSKKRSWTTSDIRRIAVEGFCGAGEWDSAYRYARQEETIDRVRFYCTIIEGALKTKERKQWASDLLSEIEVWLGGDPDSGPDPNAWLMLARTSAWFDRERCLGFMRTAVKAMNQPEPEVKKERQVICRPDDFSVTGVFRTVAAIDFQSAIDIAREISKPESSAMAQLAACKVVLSDLPVHVPANPKAPMKQAKESAAQTPAS